MDQEQIGTGGVWLRRYFEYGPLVLDGQKSSALLFDEDLQLSEQEFDTLYLLVKEKGAYLSMETLYNAICELSEEADERVAVRQGLENLANKLAAAGRGVIWLEVIPESGFALRLRGQMSAQPV